MTNDNDQRAAGAAALANVGNLSEGVRRRGCAW
jgi:hypothetical protein